MIASTSSRRILAFCVLTCGAGLLLSACGGHTVAPGSTTACPDGPRIALDCESEISYQGVKTGGSVSVMSIGSGKASYENTAIRNVNTSLESYVATQTRLCRDYNACVLPPQEYRAEAKKTREMFEVAAHGAVAFAAASDAAAKDAVLTRLYDTVVPEDRRPEDVSIRFTLDAELPSSVGGGQTMLQTGAPLPTKARVAFKFWASRTASLYVFEKTKTGALKVLFPDPRIGTANPIPAATAVSLPSGGQRFALNAEDMGIENIYIAASVKPLATLDAALQKVASGQVQNITGDPLLSSFSSVTAAPPREGCRTRSLELEAASDEPPCGSRGFDLSDSSAGTKEASLAARTSPGDDLIVKVFSFEHVTEEDYPAAMQRYRAKGGG